MQFLKEAQEKERQEERRAATGRMPAPNATSRQEEVVRQVSATNRSIAPGPVVEPSNPSDRSRLQGMLTEIKKARDYQTVCQTFEAECRKENSPMKSFSTLSTSRDDMGNTITVYVKPDLSEEEKKKPENQVKYISNREGKLTIEAGEKVSCIIPPQKKNDGVGFDIVQIENGSATKLASQGIGTGVNLIIKGKEVEASKLSPSADAIRLTLNTPNTSKSLQQSSIAPIVGLPQQQARTGNQSQSR